MSAKACEGWGPAKQPCHYDTDSRARFCYWHEKVAEGHIVDYFDNRHNEGRSGNPLVTSAVMLPLASGPKPSEVPGDAR